METKKIGVEEFIDLFASDIYEKFRQALENTERCDGTFKGVYSDDHNYDHPYSCAYWIWYDVSGKEIIWQFDLAFFNKPDEIFAPQIGQWLVDVVNDDLSLSISINA